MRIRIHDILFKALQNDKKLRRDLLDINKIVDINGKKYIVKKLCY